MRETNVWVSEKIGKFDFTEMSYQHVKKKLSIEIEKSILTAKIEIRLWKKLKKLLSVRSLKSRERILK